MEFDEFNDKLNKRIKDKLKLFLYIFNDFDLYIKNKSEKDRQLHINETQKNLMNEINATKNLKTLIIYKTKRDKTINTMDNHYNITSNSYRKSSSHMIMQDQINTLSSYSRGYDNDSRNFYYQGNNNNLMHTKKMVNSSCFGQRNIKSIPLFYKTYNEITKIKEDLMFTINKEIMNKVSITIENKKELDISKNFVLTHLHSNLNNINYDMNVLIPPRLKTRLDTSRSKNTETNTLTTRSTKSNRSKKSIKRVMNFNIPIEPKFKQAENKFQKYFNNNKNKDKDKEKITNFISSNPNYYQNAKQINVKNIIEKLGYKISENLNKEDPTTNLEDKQKKLNIVHKTITGFKNFSLGGKIIVKRKNNKINKENLIKKNINLLSKMQYSPILGTNNTDLKNLNFNLSIMDGFVIPSSGNTPRFEKKIKKIAKIDKWKNDIVDDNDKLFNIKKVRYKRNVSNIMNIALNYNYKGVLRKSKISRNNNNYLNL